VQGDAGHPGLQGGGQEKNNWGKMKGQRGGEAQGVADPPPPPQKQQHRTVYETGRFFEKYRPKIT
jgi:hypothetical protein